MSMMIIGGVIGVIIVIIVIIILLKSIRKNVKETDAKKINSRPYSNQAQIQAPQPILQAPSPQASPSGTFCRYCGDKVGSDASFCPKCGSKL